MEHQYKILSILEKQYQRDQHSLASKGIQNTTIYSQPLSTTDIQNELSAQYGILMSTDQIVPILEELLQRKRIICKFEGLFIYKPISY